MTTPGDNANSAESSLGHDPGETIAQLIRRLRTQAGETQAQFADRLNTSRSSIAAYENGKNWSVSFAEALTTEFPRENETISATARDNRTATRPASTGSTFGSDERRRVEAFLRTGRYDYAARALQRLTATATDASERYWAHERLYVALRGQGREQDAIQALRLALLDTIEADRPDEEVRVRTRLAGRLQLLGRYPEAHQALEEGIQRDPTSPRLWLRRGLVHWYEQTYPEGFAALTAARALGASRRSVLHARTQLLAEWGHSRAAIQDADSYLALATKTSDGNRAAVRSARAISLASTGHPDAAAAEFEAAERLNPDSAWTPYRHGLALLSNNEEPAAINALHTALSRHGPPLDHLRHDHATRLLRDPQRP